MRQTSFPNCCAGMIFYDFGNTKITSLNNEGVTTDEIKSSLANAEFYSKGVGFGLIAINTEQLSVMKNILEERNWKCIAENLKSTGHKQSKIYLYLFSA